MGEFKCPVPGHFPSIPACVHELRGRTSTSKPANQDDNSRIVDAKAKKTLHRVRNGEVILCKELHTIGMNGTVSPVGCQSYSPIYGLRVSPTYVLWVANERLKYGDYASVSLFTTSPSSPCQRAQIADTGEAKLSPGEAASA